MRTWTAPLLALALVASACGGSDPGAVDSPSADIPAQADPTALPDETQQSDAVAEAVTPATAEIEDTCNFEEGISPVEVIVDQITPGEFEGNPSALSDMRDPSFATPLVDVDRIRSGGPPPDGIPPLDAPRFQTAESVDWLRCTEPVLSLQIGDEARAYPLQVMTWHELVNDTIGDVPVTVSYCPLCNSALAYRRDIGDRIHSFGTSGRLFNSSLVMYDRQTESLWTHFNGKAVVGELTGVELELLPMQTTSWANFRAAHPDGLVLTRDTGFRRNYGVNPYPGYDDIGTNPFLFDGELDGRLPAKQRVVSLRAGGESKVVVLEALAAAGVLEVDLAGETLSLWHIPGTATGLEGSEVPGGRDIGAVGVYVPVLDGVRLSFARHDDESFIDEGGSIWNIQGHAISGPLAGAELEAVEHLDTFWFAIAAFEPETEIVAQ